MLVNKSTRYNPNDIISFKLVNGDEIVAKIIEETDVSYTVSKPATVIPQGQGIALIQAMFTGEVSKSLSLAKNHVMIHTPTSADVVKYYIQMTTGITPASSSKLIM